MSAAFTRSGLQSFLFYDRHDMSMSFIRGQAPATNMSLERVRLLQYLAPALSLMVGHMLVTRKDRFDQPLTILCHASLS
jgi:hypothetical protein